MPDHGARVQVIGVGGSRVMPRSSGAGRVMALLVSDTVALFASAVVAAIATLGDRPGASAGFLGGRLAMVPILAAGFAIGGLYPGFGVSAIHLLRTATRQTSLVFLIVAGTTYVLLRTPTYPPSTFVAWWLCSLVAVPLSRWLLSSAAASRDWWREPVMLFGCEPALASTVDSLSRARHLGYQPVAVVMKPLPVHATLTDDWRGLLLVRDTEAVAMAAGLGIRTALLLGHTTPIEHWASDLREHFRHVILVHSLEDRYIEPVAIRYLGTAIGMDFKNRLLVRRNAAIKRLMDIAISAGALAVLLPVMVVAAIAIALSDPGPWWHAQYREGRGGRLFRMWKLRTMYLDADERLSQHLARNPDARAEWEREFKLASDPRVLPVIGRLLRRSSLDECPQFWNVIRGEMSLVGPRALPPYHLEAFGPAFREIRRRVRPGMTGMWQVMSRGHGAIERQEALDRYYIYNWSIWMDLFVLAKTALTVPRGRGAR
jgi:Undecaprenyl-phosphate galactose phosphotransferase WbaP